MEGVLITCIVLKEDVSMLVISSKSMLGQYGFLANVFDVFRRSEVSVDVIATSEVSVSITLDPAKVTASPSWARTPCTVTLQTSKRPLALHETLLVFARRSGSVA